MAMVTIVGIKFKNCGKIYDFKCEDIDLKLGDTCIVETERGLSIGKVALHLRKKDERNIRRRLKNVLRKATDKDLEQSKKNEMIEKEAFEVCQNKIKERELPMKLVAVEFSFDASKAIFYYTAEGRIDFRELVKDMANQFKARIEMKQIGVRDEAKMSGGYGPCGRILCCASFLKDFAPVSIRMAKEQQLTLNPSKISGVCGRLMCCLVYEHMIYEKNLKDIPNLGKKVNTSEGQGKLIKIDMINEKATVELEEGKRLQMNLNELRKHNKSVQ
jgi:cell fate regulator YaaT (PSP1 superfamily)